MIYTKYKSFKSFYFVVMYIAFLLVGIIYTAQLFTNYHPKLTTWQDVASYDFELVDQTYNDDGTLTSTYGISTPEQLAGAFNMDNYIQENLDKANAVYADDIGSIGSPNQVSDEYVLLNDVNMSGRSWEPTASYKNTFNGNYHTIKGLTIEESAELVGMVGELSSGGEIKNLYLDDVDISNETSSSKTTYTGAVAGINNGTIYNVHVTSGTVVGHSKSGDTRYVGGIVGYNDTDGKIRTCSNRALIMRGNYIGGISGYNKGTIGGASNDNSYACFNYGTITNAFSTGSSYAGGITGYSTKSISVCYNSGSITNNDYSTKHPYAGGIVGRTSGAIDQCANVGTIVSGIDKYITGYNNGQPSYSDSKVEKSYAGGIVGYTTSNIGNCYNRGNITANAKSITTNEINTTMRDMMYDDRHSNEGKKIVRTELEQAYSGGIAGYCNSQISYCVNTSTSITGGQYDVYMEISARIYTTTFFGLITTSESRFKGTLEWIDAIYIDSICPTNNDIVSNCFYENTCYLNIDTLDNIKFTVAMTGDVSDSETISDLTSAAVADLVYDSVTCNVGYESVDGGYESYLRLWVVDNVDGVSFAYNQDFEEHGTKTDVKSSSFINKVNANIWAINSQINNGYPYLKNLYW